MANLKNSVISRILNQLEYGDFCREDFDLTLPDGSLVLAEVKFRALPKYSFVIDEHHTGNKFALAIAFQESETKKVIRTIESPGDYRNSENHTHQDIGSAVDRISDWVRNIREDLVHSRDVLRTTIDDLSAEFQESIDEKIENPEEYFGEDEQSDLINKLNELQERVEKLEKELELDPKDTAKIESAIEKSKADIKLYPKGVWYKTVGTKLMKLLRQILKTKEGREIAADVAKRLLS
tara:strand:- start:12349 stop:13059 length:711 start_codon:yes stop_codon:yes gene_type:complete